jgi:predicted nucleic acid-binding protein
LRGQGRVLSQVDMMLAALARQHKLSILTTDRDFEALSDLTVENWVVSSG